MFLAMYSIHVSLDDQNSDKLFKIFYTSHKEI